MSAAKAIRYAT